MPVRSFERWWEGASSIGLIAWSMVVLAGCAAGELGGDECSGDEECPGAARCVRGECRSADGGLLPGSDASDAGGEGAREAGTGRDVAGGDADDPGRDAGPSGDVDPSDGGGPGCPDECGVGERCEQGQCVSRCRPLCRPEQQCVDLGEGPRCYESCSEAQSAQECRDGRLCRDVLSGEEQEMLVCAPSQCAGNDDCQSGTCLKFINGHGRCVSSGEKAIGESCDLSSGDELCEPGAFCIRESDGSSLGTCRRLCDPWAESSSCGSETRCSLFKERSDGLSVISFRQGYCNPTVDATGSEPFADCSTNGAMCDHAVRCVGGEEATCVKWCRNSGDCVGTAPPRFATSATCNNYVFGSVRRVGRCEPSCRTDADCTEDGMTCHDDVCRRTCEMSTVQEDCCGGSSPCRFECHEGLCR